MQVCSDLTAFCLCSAGHVALMVAILNRIQGLRIERSTLKLFQAGHYLVMLAFPLAMLRTIGDSFTGVVEPFLLWRLPALLQVYGLGCLAIAAIAPAIGFLRTCRSSSHVLRSSRSVVHSLPVPAGHRPRLVERIPGNQFRQVELSEKQLEIPGLPTVWEGLSILHLSDLHFTGNPERAFFEQVLQSALKSRPDLIAFTGDLLDRAELLEWLPSTLGRLNAPLGCHYVLGNHDWTLGSVIETRRTLAALGWNDATRTSSLEHNGHRLLICGAETPWMGKLPDLPDARAGSDRSGEPEFRLFLSHSPDAIGWAKSRAIDLMLAGHTHGGQVRVPGFGSIYSPSLYGGRYASGVFFEAPTVMHVSRGLSGETPLRLNCRPEITRLVLHAPLTFAPEKQFEFKRSEAAVRN